MGLGDKSGWGQVLGFLLNPIGEIAGWIGHGQPGGGGKGIKNLTSGIGSWWNSTTGKGSDWEKYMTDLQNQWAERNFERDQEWRNQDIERQTQWRNEDIERNTMKAKMQEAKEAGVHPMTLLGGTMGAGGGSNVQVATQSGNRMPKPTGGGRAGDMMGMIGAMTDLARVKMEKDSIAKQNAYIQAQTRMTNAEAENQEYENTKEQRSSRNIQQEAEIKKIISDTNLSDHQKNLIEKETERFAHDNEYYLRSPMTQHDYDNMVARFVGTLKATIGAIPGIGPVAERVIDGLILAARGGW